jgi:hypothetical protein
MLSVHKRIRNHSGCIIELKRNEIAVHVWSQRWCADEMIQAEADIWMSPLLSE